MKKIQLVVLMMLFAVASFAQSQPKVIAVVNTASWCPACQANGQRVEKDIVASYAGSYDVAFVVNNLTDDATKATSKITLEEKGVYDAVSSIKSTGLIVLVDANTKKVISQVAVAKTTDEIKMAINASTKNGTPKVIAVINTATWCPSCKANGKRVETDIVASYMGNTNISFFVNDLSTDETKKTCKENLEKEGVYDAVKGIKVTGLIILLNAETHEVIQQIGVKETNETLKQAIDTAING